MAVRKLLLRVPPKGLDVVGVRNVVKVGAGLCVGVFRGNVQRESLE